MYTNNWSDPCLLNCAPYDSYASSYYQQPGAQPAAFYQSSNVPNGETFTIPDLSVPPPPINNGFSLPDTSPQYTNYTPIIPPPPNQCTSYPIPQQTLYTEPPPPPPQPQYIQNINSSFVQPTYSIPPPQSAAPNYTPINPYISNQLTEANYQERQEPYESKPFTSSGNDWDNWSSNSIRRKRPSDHNSRERLQNKNSSVRRNYSRVSPVRKSLRSPSRNSLRSVIRKSPSRNSSRSSSLQRSPLRTTTRSSLTQKSPLRRRPRSSSLSRKSPLRSPTRLSSSRKSLRKSPLRSTRLSPKRKSLRKSPLRSPTRLSPSRKSPLRSLTRLSSSRKSLRKSPLRNSTQLSPRRSPPTNTHRQRYRSPLPLSRTRTRSNSPSRKVWSENSISDHLSAKEKVHMKSPRSKNSSSDLLSPREKVNMKSPRSKNLSSDLLSEREKVNMKSPRSKNLSSDLLSEREKVNMKSPRSKKSSSDLLSKREKISMKLPPPKKIPPKAESVTNTFSFDEPLEHAEEEMNQKPNFEEVKAAWVRSAPADLYYNRDDKNPSIMRATQKLIDLCNTFEETLIMKAKRLREERQREYSKSNGTTNVREKNGKVPKNDDTSYLVSKSSLSTSSSLEEDKTTSSRSREDKHSTSCNKEDKHSTSCNKEDKHSTSCNKEDKHSTSCNKEDKHSTSCNKERKYSTSCNKEDNYSTSCNKEGKHSTSCNKEDKESNSYNKGDNDESVNRKTHYSSKCSSHRSKREKRKSDSRSWKKGEKDKGSSSSTSSDSDDSVSGSGNSSSKSSDNKLSTSSNKQDKHLTSCNKEDQHPTSCNKEDKHSSTCNKHNKESNSCNKEDKHSTSCNKQDKHSTSCNKQDKHSTSSNRDKHSTYCSKQDKHSSSCYREDKESNSCNKEDKHSTYCSKQDKHSSSCNKEDKESNSCNKEDKHSTYCSKQDRHSSSCNKEDKESNSCNKEEKHSTYCSKQDKHSSSCSKQDKHSSSCSKQDKPSTPSNREDKESNSCTKGDNEESTKRKTHYSSKCSSSSHRSKRAKRRKSDSRSWKKAGKDKGSSSSTSSDSDDSVSGSGNSSSSSSNDNEDEWPAKGAEEMERKRNHPDRLHPELWFNDPGEMNDGPLCRCSLKARRSGIRHGYYAGEESLEPCDMWSNNADRLYHYLVTISPPTNFLVKTPSAINHDNHEFIFEGFSLLSHQPLEEVPTCQVIRFNIEYSIFYVQDKMPENFCVKELELFYEYMFREILELVDLNFRAVGDTTGCPRFHFLPRFVRELPDNGKEVLSMNEVLKYLIRSYTPLVPQEELAKLIALSEHDWLNYTDQVKGMIVMSPAKKPCSIRVDQLDRDQSSEDTIHYPVIVHFGIRPPQLSYAGNPLYQKALREYVKFRHLLANMPKPSFEDKGQLEMKESRLQEIRMGSKMKRDVTVAISAEGFFRTGVMCDIVQHALLIPLLVRHLRFHQSLSTLERKINYKFSMRFLLQLALTHPSYRENFGTNPDHARNSLTNCGVRQPQYGDRRIHFMTTHKRGINTLVNIMSRFGKNEESESKITHNERLEFLGDAVVEFLTSIHLFHLFPTLEEGGLATYRAAVVQNQHLSVLADKLGLDQFVLHAHGSDLCHTVELRHAMANCFEALMGAIFLDTNIEAADAVFSATLFKDETELHDIWVNYKPHPLQEQEPEGDRRWIETFPILQKLTKFEESIGVEFTHIRLLARAFMDRSVGFNYLTLGSNQRLEFLGDTVLQLVTSEHLYRFFPEHHEGHLSLLRSSLVNNRTQAVVCDDLQLTQYAMYSNLKTELKTKERADLLEAFLGALYIDCGLEYCRLFSLVCFFPRLQPFIINQEWNDPKSKLQQCCLTLRTMEGGEPDIPVYKVIECKGPTNTRMYTVAVYFKNKRLAKASGHSIQQAEMNAAKEALVTNKKMFPQLAYQKRVIEKNIKIQGVDPPSDKKSSSHTKEGGRKDARRPPLRRDQQRRSPDRKNPHRLKSSARDRSGREGRQEGARLKNRKARLSITFSRSQRKLTSTRSGGRGVGGAGRRVGGVGGRERKREGEGSSINRSSPTRTLKRRRRSGKEEGERSSIAVDREHERGREGDVETRKYQGDLNQR